MLFCTDVLMLSHPALLILKGLLAWAGWDHTAFARASRAKFVEKSENEILEKCGGEGKRLRGGTWKSPHIISCTGLKSKEFLSLGIAVKYI